VAKSPFYLNQFIVKKFGEYEAKYEAPNYGPDADAGHDSDDDSLLRHRNLCNAIYEDFGLIMDSISLSTNTDHLQLKRWMRSGDILHVYHA